MSKRTMNEAELVGTGVADEVVASADTMPLERLEAEITTLAGHLAAAVCRWLLLVAEFDRREGWARWECRSCAHWLSWQCGLDMRTAHDHVRVARALGSLPSIRAAFTAGEVSYSKVRAMTRVANPANEEALLSIARHGTTHHLEVAVRGYRRAKVDDDLDEAERRRNRRFFRWWHDEDGMVRFSGCLHPEDAAVVITALTEATPPHQAVEERSAERTGAREVPGDSLGARQADALVSLADTMLASGPIDRTGTDRTMVHVHVSAETLLADADGECRIEGVSAIPAETARRLGCDATWLTTLDDPNGNPLHVSRATPSISPRLRRALRQRDHERCQFPGAGDCRNLQVHHVVHRAHGGPTRLDNLLLLCKFHHRVLHEGGYRVEARADGGFDFYRRNGTWIDPDPIQPDRTGPGIEAVNIAHGLTIDDHTGRSRWDGFHPRSQDLVEAVLDRDHTNRN